MITHNMQTSERYRRIYKGDVRMKSLLAVVTFVLGLGFMQVQAFVSSPRAKLESPNVAAGRNAIEAKDFKKVAAANEVGIGDFEFIPSTLTVSVGTTVTWGNRDEEAHTVNSTTDVFKSPPLDTDEKFSFKFTTPGTYPYYCKLHPHMKGQIIVR